MIDRLKIPVIIICVTFLTWWIGSGLFNYFTHATSPLIVLKGIEHNGSYASQVPCTISSENDYKIAQVAITLDQKPFLIKQVKASQFEVPFAIDTTTLPDGQHTLEIEAIDASYNRNKTQKIYTFNIDNTPLHAAFIDKEYMTRQGKTLHMKIQSNKRLAHAQFKFLSNVYSFYPESEDSTRYECFVPVDCEERPSEHLITVEVEDLVKNKLKLTNKVRIGSYEFKHQRGFSVQEDKLAHEKEIGMSTKILNEALDKWLLNSPKKKLWTGPFDYPIQVQRMTTPFGEIRMTPERGRYLHKGVDLINRPKSVVWAAQDGNVIIKDRFFLTGNTVVIDHGLGIFTLYAHLEEFADVEIGNMIKKGSPIGKLGMTGYATGYHLHWELRVNNVPVDPLEWTHKVF